MGKAVYIFVRGDGDCDAMLFEETYNEQKVYEEMLAEGVSRKQLPVDDGMTIDVRIVEFDAVDPGFESFIKNELCDYDALKASDIYRVEPK